MGSEHQKDDAIDWANKRIAELETQLAAAKTEGDNWWKQCRSSHHLVQHYKELLQQAEAACAEKDALLKQAADALFDLVPVGNSSVGPFAREIQAHLDSDTAGQSILAERDRLAEMLRAIADHYRCTDRHITVQAAIDYVDRGPSKEWLTRQGDLEDEIAGSVPEGGE